MSDLKFPEWQEPYQEALVEFNPEKLRERIFKAETAILERIQTLQGAIHEQEERQAIDDALRVLRLLKRDRLKYPDWKADEA